MIILFISKKMSFFLSRSKKRVLPFKKVCFPKIIVPTPFRCIAFFLSVLYNNKRDTAVAYKGVMLCVEALVPRHETANKIYIFDFLLCGDTVRGVHLGLFPPGRHLQRDDL